MSLRDPKIIALGYYWVDRLLPQGESKHKLFILLDDLGPSEGPFINLMLKVGLVLLKARKLPPPKFSMDGMISRVPLKFFCSAGATTLILNRLVADMTCCLGLGVGME